MKEEDIRPQKIFDEYLELAKKELTNLTDESIYARDTSLKIIDDYALSQKKNPTKALILSLVPGGGYIYAGHKQTGITSLLINSMLAYATINSFQKENYGLGILTGVFNLSFYVGNMQGAKKSADRYNENIKYNSVSKLESITNLN